jgi:hypothetical protein
MSSEQSINTRALQNSNVANVALELDKKKTPNILKKRVNINHLLVKLRHKERLQRKENLLFFGGIGLLISIVGIIATL